MYRLALIIISAFALLPSPALAKESNAAAWIVSQLSGDARVVRSGLQPASLKANVQLAPGDTVVTGATGRATLVHGGDYIVIAPRSQMRLPAEAQPTGFTRVIQNLGTMLFKVQHTGVPHFAVDTPMLAAVVKGTTFTIVVDKDRSAVQVIQGVVQVTTVDGGMSRPVEGGRTVFVNRADPTRLLEADSPAAATPTSSAVRITGTTGPSVATIAALTEGLVRAEAAPPKARKPSTASSQAATGPIEVAASTTLPVTNVADAVAAPVTNAVDAGVPPVTNVVDTVVPPVRNVVDTVIPPVSGIVATVVPPVANVVVTVVPPVANIVDTVVLPVANIVDTVVPPVANVINTVVPPVTNVVDTVVTPVTNIVNTVVTPVTNIVDTVVPPVTNVVDTVVTPVTNVVDTVVAPVTKLIDPIVAPVLNLLGGLSR
jgi:hypothetical protein